VRQQILRLKHPCLDCAFFVHEELKKVLHTIEIPGLSRFKILQAEIYKVRIIERTRKKLKNLRF